MGCDIHMILERKKKNRKKWEHETIVKCMPRMYWMFSLLAGVRSEDGEQPVFKERGIPNDASERYKELCERWEGDGHTHSWLTLEEYKKVLEEYERLHNPLDFNNEYSEVRWEMECIEEDGNKARACFFFDN